MTRIVGSVGALVLALGLSAGMVALAEPIHAASLRKIPPPLAIAWVQEAQRGCGSVRDHRWDHGTWRCVFSDDFEGTALDLTRWNPATTAASGFSTGVPPAYVCYVYKPRTVSVSGGRLHLSVVKRQDRMQCGGPADQPTRYVGGAVSTKKRLALTYGRFEVRARFGVDARAGLQSSIELRPDHYAYGRKSGEIDLAHYYTVWPQRVFPQVLYKHPGDDPSARNDACQLADPSAFHTYTAEWTPQRIDLSVDGKKCVSTEWSLSTSLRHPAPFDKAFFLSIYQALGSSSAAYDAKQKPTFPSTMDVDYVHVWGDAED